MILPGLVLLCPHRLSRFCSIPPFDVHVKGTVLQGSGTVSPPVSTILLEQSTDRRFRWRVCSYRVLYSCAPSRPLSDSVFSRFDQGREGTILRGLVLMFPLLLSSNCNILPFAC